MTADRAEHQAGGRQQLPLLGGSVRLGLVQEALRSAQRVCGLEGRGLSAEKVAERDTETVADVGEGLEAWIGDVEAVVTPQLARRDHPRSTGALETALRDVKKALTLQRGSYDSIERLDLLLGLMTLRANRLDRAIEYAEVIRRSATG